MKRALFQPFDLGRWMVLGFTAWLAQLVDGSNGGSSSGGSDGVQFKKNLNDEFLGDSAQEAWHWFTGFADNAIGLLLIAVAIVVFVVIVVLLTWLSSRGRFMFLDNLVQGKTEVTAPWQEFQREGDSLFVWQIVYGFISLIVLGTIMTGFLTMLVPAFAGAIHVVVGLPLAMTLGTLLFIIVIVMSYIDYFLNFFIVPIMHKHRVGTMSAWGLFLPLFKANPGPFALIGLLHLAISAVMGIAYVLGGFLTCCVGLLLLALPYIGTVVTLPMSVTMRFMNLAFLAQFGPDFTLIPPMPDHPEPDSGQFDTDGTMVRTEDVGEDSGADETGPQDT